MNLESRRRRSGVHVTRTSDVITVDRLMLATGSPEADLEGDAR